MPRISVPVAVPESSLNLSSLTVDKRSHNVGYLITIDFYYLLQSCKYTKPLRIKRNGQLVHATRTCQFQVQDIGFWKNGKILPRHLPLERLLTADSATMNISNQNNVRMEKILHHDSTV